MNLFLLWLRRDLRRHAPRLLLWALLVALFTWARLWLYHHPEVHLWDRDLWLSVPAVILGVGEVCLLLGILLDDPARGARSFWKTRPPSGMAVFGAKAMLLVVAAFVIPLAGEAVFMGLAYPSGGFWERMAFYLLPPLLALMAGAAAMSWGLAFVWLPVAIFTLWAGGMAFALMMMSGGVLYMADPVLFMAAALLTAAVCLFTGYARRRQGRVFVIAAIGFPPLVLTSVAGTGWLLDSRVNAPPEGIAAADLGVSWEPDSVPLRRDSSHGTDLVLEIPLAVGGIPEGFALQGKLYDLTLTPGDQKEIRPGVLRAEHIQTFRKRAGRQVSLWQITVNQEEANTLLAGPCVARGKLSLLFSRRWTRQIPLTGTPAIPEMHIRCIGSGNDGPWSVVKFMGPGEIAPTQSLVRIDRFTASLHSRDGTTVVPLRDFMPFLSLNLWEGTGTNELGIQFAGTANVQALPKEGDVHFDLLMPAGRLEIPFELDIPKPKTLK